MRIMDWSSDVCSSDLQLINAQQSYDPQSNQPVVSIRFDSGGSSTFAKVTAQNVGKRFAMVLDGKVQSAPSINEPILGGSAQISGRFSVADRKSGGEGKGGAVSVMLGGRRIL